MRWPGEGIEWCAASGERSEPIDGACVFPIDLLHKPGPLELTRRRSGRLERVSVRVTRFDYPVQKLTLPSRMVDLSPADLERVRRENREIGAALEGARSAPLQPPARGAARPAARGRPLRPPPHHQRQPAQSPRRRRLRGARGHAGARRGRWDGGDGGGPLLRRQRRLRGPRRRAGHAVLPPEPRRRARGTARSTAAPRSAPSAPPGAPRGPHLHFGVRFRGARVEPALLLGLLADALPRLAREPRMPLSMASAVLRARTGGSR